MPQAEIQRGFRMLLALTILLGGVIPPGVRHAHAEGGRPHRHDCSCRHEHTGDHDECTVVQVVAHIHVNIFGFSVSLRASDPDHRDGQEHDPNKLTFVSIGASDPAIGGEELSSLRYQLQPTLLPPAACCHADADSTDFANATESCAIPLCDSARRERSGVFNV